MEKLRLKGEKKKVFRKKKLPVSYVWMCHAIIEERRDRQE